MNKLRLFTRYYITRMRGGLVQSRRRGTELPCMFREGLDLEIRLSRMRSSSGEEQEERILKSSKEAV